MLPGDRRAGEDGALRAASASAIPEPLLTRVFDALPTQVAIVDRDGRIVGVNAEWARSSSKRGLDVPAASWIGIDYLDACRGDTSGQAACAGIVEVLEGRLDAFRQEYPCHGPTERQWFVMQVTPTSVPSPESAGTVIDGAVIVHSDISVSKLTEMELERAAMYDALTQLPNRSGLDRAIAGSRVGAIAGAIFIDLDRLKWVNDSFGHQAGDRLISAVGERLHAVAGSRELVARIGGDEFVVLTRAARDRDGVIDIAQRIKEAMEVRFDLGGGRFAQVSASIGVAVAGHGEADAATLLRDADTAMYRSKHGGRGEIVVFDAEMARVRGDDLALETALRSAVANGELWLCYQPQCSLRTGETIGYEALLRWQRPGVGTVMPDLFIPTAEESQLIAVLGAWVLEQACRDAAERTAGQFSGATLSVNVSPHQLVGDEVVDHVIHALSVSGLAPSRLVLEITEFAGCDSQAVRSRIAELRGLGVGIAIDGCHAGHTSLASMLDLDIDILTLDRSLIGTLGQDEAHTAIVAGVIGVADAAGWGIVAEGVETETQHQTLLELGCRVGQGFLYGRPASTVKQGTVPARRRAT